MAYLHITSGPSRGRRIELDRELVIGRAGDMSIDDPDLSPRHMVVRPGAGACEVEDLGSTSGTFVNDRRIEMPTAVGHGARVRLGTTVFEVEDGAAVESIQADEAAGPASFDLSKVGAFNPPSSHRSGVASRSWVPIVLSFATVALTAVALVVYFATR